MFHFEKDESTSLGAKIIMVLDSSKASVPDCIPVVVLKNRKPERSCILAELFNICLKDSCFPDC